MKPLARKSAASLLSAALLAGTFPRGALADPPKSDSLDAAIRASVSSPNVPGARAAAPRGPAAAAAPVTVPPAKVMQDLKEWGVLKGDDDVLRSYIGDGRTLTPLGESLYRSLTVSHDPKVDKAALIDEVLGMQPALDRLRQNGPYDEKKEQSVARTLSLFEQKFGKIDARSDGSVEDEFMRGAQREALMTGAAVTDPPKQSDMVQVKTKDGFEFWDAKGLAYRINTGDAEGKNAATTYNRELQKAQRAMNQNRPTQVEFVPETGRYSPQMFAYSYYRLKNQYDALNDGMRRDRMMALADLLGVTGKYKDDMWFTDDRILADLEAEAAKKVYSHRGRDYSVLDLVNEKFKQRVYYLEKAKNGVDRFKIDMDGLAAGFKTNPVITDAQVKNLSMDEQGALRYLSLGVLETQSFYTKNQMEKLDPSSPDSEQVMKAIDASALTPDEKANYKARAKGMVDRLHALDGVLEKTREALSAADYAGSLDMANAALTSSQRELGALGADYAMFVEIPTVGAASDAQRDVSWMNFGAKFMRWGYKHTFADDEYKSSMSAIQANQAKYTAIARLIADGKTAEARNAVIQMNPDAVKGQFLAALGGEPSRITEMARVAASLKANRDRIGAVAETNKWLDTSGTFITWTVDMAIAAPVLRMGANGVGQWLGRFTGEAAAGEVSGLSKYWVVRRAAIVGRETLLHTAARLQSLDPDAVWVESQANNAATRYLLATAVRAGNVAARQGSFTLMSGGISGAFTLGQHLWDVGTTKVFGPGQSATVDLPLFGNVGIRPNDSMFNSDFRGAVDAFWTGAKGGIWWANTPMEVGGVPMLMPGMLGYVGMPATVFRDTTLMRYAELVGSRGVVGSAVTGTKWLLGSGGAAAEGAVQRGWLERLAGAGEAGTWTRRGGFAASFTLGMVDNVAKYAVFSNVVGMAGNAYAYHFTYHDESNIERRIKGANQSGQGWAASPAWMLIPTYAAHPMRDAAIYQRGVQGAEQYKAAGRDHEIANAEEGARLRFLKTPETPISQLIFETSFKSPETGDYFIVTKEMRREAIKSQMISSLGGEKATAADISPMEFYRATKMKDNEVFVNLNVNDEVRLIAHQDFVEALLADPKRAKSVLDAPLGENVPGFGRVTPEVQKDVAVALYSSEMQAGKSMPPELSGRVGEILKPYLDANQKVKPFAEKLIKALNAAPEKSAALDAALQDVMDKVKDWKQNKNPDEHPYTELVGELRAEADRLKADGKLTDKEHAVLAQTYDYIMSIEERFNAFNNVAKTRSLADETLGALKTQYAPELAAQNSKLKPVMDVFTSKLEKWADAHGPKDFVDGRRSDGTFQAMVHSLAQELEKAKGGLTDAEFAAMKKAVEDIGSAPWVLHDAKGSALPSWRPEQFESFMGTLTAFGEQGRGGAPVRLFQMLKTGGGKTMLTFEGLLPLVEADGADRDMQPMFLTVQSNLEAQARMEFIAYKKIGSSLKFDTYEGFKTKIAEGKTKGRRALRDYWILGDEMDGAALQPALTIGQVSGGVPKRSPVYNRIDELDTGMANRLTADQDSRDTRALTESRRTQNALARLEGKGAIELINEGARLEDAAGRLKDARGPESRRAAQADVRDGVARLEKLLDAVPSRDSDAVSAARQSLGRLKEALNKPSTTDAAAREASIKELEAGFTREENLLRLTNRDEALAEQGLNRLALEAGVRGAELEGRVARLKADVDAARASKTPGSAERASALADELALAQKELAIVDRFRSEDAGQRLANLQEKIAAANAEPATAKPGALAEWKQKAAEYESGLRDEARPTAKAHAEALARVYDIGGQIRDLDAQIGEAARHGSPAEDLKARRAALESDFETVRSEAARLKQDLSAGSSTGDLGGMIRRLHVLKSDPSPAARAERSALLEKAVKEVRRRLSASADDVSAQARAGGTGWQDGAVRLLERRRQMMEAFAGLENPFYTAFRGMKDDMQAYAMNQALKKTDKAAYEKAQKVLMNLVEGRPLSRVPFKVAKLAYEVFTGRDVDVPLDQVGLTRLHAAKLLKALLADPTLPAHQRDNLFWSLSSSLLWPGRNRSSSWVRTELLRQLHGFEEDPAGIRMDSRTGRINVVHNGQWFESMDNESRRFWELEYGVDLTLPYTNQSISTIKDVTTDKKARFISFSGTAGEKLRQHFAENEIRIEGEGSRPPMDPNRAVVGSLDTLAPAIRAEIEGELGRPLQRGDVLNLSQFTELSEPARAWLGGQRRVVVEGLEDLSAENRAAIEAKRGRPLAEGDILRPSDFVDLGPGAAEWLAGLPPEASVDMGVVSGPADRMTEIGRALSHVNASRGKVVVDPAFARDAPPAVREALEKKFGGPISETKQVALADFADPKLAETRDWLTALRMNQGDVDHVVVRKGDAIPADAQPAIDAYLKRMKLEGKSDAVVRISEVTGADDASTAAARNWLRDLRKNQKDTGLVVLSVSDTRVLKQVREYLMRVQGLKADEISMVFSDTEYLRNNVPEAKVAEQMNLDALNDGRARVLILDTRVGGRGLDLNFKGERGSLDPKAFRGYTSFEMLIVDPQKMSQVHLLQAEGRIDLGRVLPGASRDFSLVMDVRSVQNDRVFRDMIAEDPFFVGLRNDPKFVEFETARGGKADWTMFHDYVRMRAAEGTADGALLAEQYQDAVKKNLEIQQGEVEENQLRSSSVLPGQAKTDAKYPGLEGMR